MVYNKWYITFPIVYIYVYISITYHLLREPGNSIVDDSIESVWSCCRSSAENPGARKQWFHLEDVICSYFSSIWAPWIWSQPCMIVVSKILYFSPRFVGKWSKEALLIYWCGFCGKSLWKMVEVWRFSIRIFMHPSQKILTTIPKTDIGPENQWLEDE